MGYQVSNNCISILKEIHKDTSFKPLKDKKDVKDLLMAFTFLSAAVEYSKKSGKLDEKKYDETKRLLKEAFDEISSHVDDLDIEYLNYQMEK